MRKRWMEVLGPFVCFMLVAGYAHAYTIDNTPDHRIGDSAFNIYGINVFQSGGNLTFDIYTNYPQGGLSVAGWNTKPGDLAIDPNKDGNYEYGIAFTAHNGLIAGELYKVDSTTGWKISGFDRPNDGFSWNQNKIVQLDAGENPIPQYQGSVTWISTGGSNPSFYIEATGIPIAALGIQGDSFNVFYASATCANDYVGGTAHVPEPATILLLGSGLIGIWGARRKYKK